MNSLGVRRGFVAWLLFAASTAGAAEVLLGCIGAVTRDEGRQDFITKTMAVQVRLNLDTPSIKIDGLSCWAGAGDCLQLKVKSFENAISATGDGKLAKTGYFTSIEIDRRTGFMKFAQRIDKSSGIPVASSPITETGEFICQVNAKPLF